MIRRVLRRQWRGTRNRRRSEHRLGKKLNLPFREDTSRKSRTEKSPPQFHHPFHFNSQIYSVPFNLLSLFIRLIKFKESHPSSRLLANDRVISVRRESGTMALDSVFGNLLKQNVDMDPPPQLTSQPRVPAFLNKLHA
jgi:hypothetical protein